MKRDYSQAPRCGKPLTRNAAGETCGRREGHTGDHLSQSAIDNNYHQRREQRRAAAPTPGAVTVTDPVRATEWLDKAACVYTDPEIFFPEPGRVDTAAAAIAICNRCPVIAECLDYAMSRQIVDGIYGGLTTKERKRLRRTERAA